jgi:glycerol-3-phosphate acyltransferase PlsY
MTIIFGVADVSRLLVPVLNSRFTSSLALFLRQEEDRRVTGATYFLLGATVTVLIFPEEIAALALVFLALGDPTAGIVGRLSGKAKLWGRTMEGDLACLGVCVAAALVTIHIVGAPAWTVGLGGALVATVLQALPLGINDNLTIPIGSAAVMFFLEMIFISLG